MYICIRQTVCLGMYRKGSTDHRPSKFQLSPIRSLCANVRTETHIHMSTPNSNKDDYKYHLRKRFKPLGFMNQFSGSPLALPQYVVHYRSRFLSLPEYRTMCTDQYRTHDDVIKWKHFSPYWPFVRGIHRSRVNSPLKGH